MAVIETYWRDYPIMGIIYKILFDHLGSCIEENSHSSLVLGPPPSFSSQHEDAAES